MIERIWQTGCEIYGSSLYGTSVEFPDGIVGFNGWAVFSNTIAKSGTYSISVFGNGFSDNRAAVKKILPSTYTQVRLSLCLYTGANVGGGGAPIFSLMTISGNQLRLFKEGSVQVGSNLTVLQNTWIHIGLDIKKDASSGWVYLYIDGTLVASFDGNTAATAIEQLNIGSAISSGAGTTFNGTFYYDDIYIDNSLGETSPQPIEDFRFIFKSINNDGSYLEWTPFTGSVHYTLLDELSPNTTDYVYSNAPGQRDSYGFQDYTLSVGASISALIPVSYIKKESTADILIGSGFLLSGTASTSLVFQSLATSYTLKYQRYATNPFGDAWSENDVKNSEFYMMSSGTFA